jgi:succinate dehydrogenase/fumarate reductase flavoprotein subunit
MLEKAAVHGGTTAKSGGGYWIPNNKKMRDIGLTDSKPDAMKYMVRLSYPTLYDPEHPMLGLGTNEYGLIETFYDQGSVMADEFETKGYLKGKISADQLKPNDPKGYPDYHADLAEDKAPYGRPLSPAGEKGGGAGMVAQLKDQADKFKIPIELGNRVVRIFRNSKGEVVGVEATTTAGKSVSIRANKAVVFGSGGFTHNLSMRTNYLRGPVFGGCAVPTNTGDLVMAATEIGAALGNMNNAWWGQLPLEVALQNASVPNLVWLPYGDSMIQVNRYGNRVFTEKMVYNERTQVHFLWDPSTTEYSNKVLFMIYDRYVAQDPRSWGFRYPVPMPSQQAPYVISGASLDELATNIDARLAKYGKQLNGFRLADGFASGLRATVSRFNSFAQSGTDRDFGRGSTPIQVQWNGPPRQGNPSNPTMFPLAPDGPYYAIILGGGTLDTKGGPVINTKAQVINTQGNVIAGLYGAGNCIASPAGQAYWSGGGTLGPALTYGRLAGMNAATEPVKEL